MQPRQVLSLTPKNFTISKRSRKTKMVIDTKKIKDTLLLPKTTFPLKNVNHLETEKKIRELWETKKIYQQILIKNQNNLAFFLHSGPPYANGKIHLGHVLNFLIKDIIVRFQASEGFYTPFLLG